MYCPNCGSLAAEGTKFCRQCGLSLNKLAEYIASGGTDSLLSQPSERKMGRLTPTQQLVLTIMFFVFTPALFGVIGQQIGMEELAGIPAVLMPLGIVWACFHYKNQRRRLRENELRRTLEPSTQNLPSQLYQPPLQSAPTNPIVGSVIEDETKQLPERRR
jgi:hypothetical protein